MIALDMAIDLFFKIPVLIFEECKLVTFTIDDFKIRISPIMGAILNRGLRPYLIKRK